VSPLLQFDFADTTSGIKPCRFVNPTQIIEARRIEDVIPAIARVQEAVNAGHFAAGFLSYEAAPAFDPAMAAHHAATDLPLVWFGIYEMAAPVDETTDCCGAYQVGEWRSPVDDDRFRDEVSAIRNSIAAGDVYQVNHTVRLRAPFQGDAFSWYRCLRCAQQGRYSAYLDLGRYQIVSLSPELFFQLTPPPLPTVEGSGLRITSVPSNPIHSRKIVTRPMKGTHCRGRWTREDLEFGERLACSDKERAENLMIVDLLRNDLGRIAEIGSVLVDQLFTVERYPTLLQMTSTVSGQLRNAAGLPEILEALFPCGSVTGAPKIAAMKQIAELEPEPRQVYCGTIGYLEPTGRAVFNVAIRTALVDRETNVVEYGVGSGITWDSQPERESAENRLKAAILNGARPIPDLFETLRLEDGRFVRRERHLRRICDSAGYFGIPCDEILLHSALDTVQTENRCGIWRVRLRLTAAGRVSAERVPLAELGDGPLAFALCPQPVDRNDRYLFHKVADRAFYSDRKSSRPETYDVLLQNKEGEVTEFTTGNLVLDINGERVTPPLESGLLPGVLRGELLDAGAIVERTLNAADLQRAKVIWLINSLRGWVRMTLVE